MSLRYVLLVTGPAYGSQSAYSAYQFSQALLAVGHRIECVFFYREGVTNANQLTLPANDEFHLVKAWQTLSREHNISLHVCVAAALRRGVIDRQEAEQNSLTSTNLADGFELSGLGTLAEAVLMCDRTIQF